MLSKSFSSAIRNPSAKRFERMKKPLVSDREVVDPPPFILFFARIAEVQYSHTLEYPDHCFHLRIQLPSHTTRPDDGLLITLMIGL